jgi:hypothetical protein
MAYVAAVQSLPALRKVPANILSWQGWLHGIFHVPQHQSLMDYFGGAGHLLKCTRVRLPSERQPIPFVALRQEGVSLIEPTLDEEFVEAPGGIGRTASRQVGCLLHGGILRGSLEVLVNVRLSDFLRQRPAMIVMRRCVLTPYGEPPDGAGVRRFKLVLVNLAQASGVSEWEEERAAPGI